jgi:hypothetical protein
MLIASINATSKILTDSSDVKASIQEYCKRYGKKHLDS